MNKICKNCKFWSVPFTKDDANNRLCENKHGYELMLFDDIIADGNGYKNLKLSGKQGIQIRTDSMFGCIMFEARN